ncbi:hypothetical protein M0L20_11160 [Spirosoma sp. RP8]|uniref:Uncharacterized protein n=1 Tax=Spirosoma liriopis TaxID=2937440 RepID=A0ABT0HJV1_9BACT|nr:hypothetical protein [Spirosoma liriopis]MCK8492411.1 hypothetical protein [Spirosoma liriopis]
MRTNLTRKVTNCVAILSLVACPFVPSVVKAMPAQGGLRTVTETEKLAKTPVLARNTTAKTETTPTTTTSKEPQHDKKTISRCWKRLMNMVREVNQAHKNTDK